jgi:signal peptidase I
MSKLREYVEALVIAVIFLKFANCFVLQTFYIPSGSMEDTLLVGDHLFVDRFVYGPGASALERRLLPLRPVERGDVVVFRSVENPEIDVVKRCVGLPGDTVAFVAKQLYLNGKRVEDSSYALHRDPIVYPPLPVLPAERRNRDTFGPITVPPDHYFCLGDNRDNSHDSRFWGPLPAHMIKGRALIVYWSIDYGGETPDEAHGLGAEALQLTRTLLGFFTRTRWSRTGHLIR